MNARRVPRSLGVAALGILCAAGASCAKKVVSLPSGPVTISGHVNDAGGLPLANTTVRLVRGLHFVETKTDAAGAYAFTSLKAESYLLIPRREDCKFLPHKAYLENVVAGTTLDFGSFGPACGGEPTVNAGATSGPLTVSGHVRDAAGHPVVGARIDLDNHTEAIRFTGISGAYTFHLKSDKYKVRVSGPCTFTPGDTIKEHVKANLLQDFVAGSGCATTLPTNVTATGSVLTVRQGSTVLGTTYVRVEPLASAAEGLTRLGDIAAEQPTAATKTLTIAGNPAIERQTLVRLPGPMMAGPAGPPPRPFLAITTAVAVGNRVVRFESQLSDDAPAATIARFIQIGRNFTPDAIPDLHGPLPTPRAMIRHTPPGPPLVAPGLTASGVVSPGSFGELEIAAFDTKNVIVYGTQNGPFRSTNGGQTITASTFNTAPAPPNTLFVSNGDPTVAVGAPDASFNQVVYFAQLQTAAPPAVGITPIVAIGLYQSPDGQTFNNVSFPINCASFGAGCVVPDQEHLVADRINRAVTPTGSADQLYLAWRNFTSPNSNAQAIAVACSQDGGVNWTIDQTTLVPTGGSFPRVTVGPDGTLLVAYGISPLSGPYILNVQKFTSCANGFQPDGKPVQVVKAVNEVSEMAGLDRPAQGNYAPAYDSGTTGRMFIVYSNEATPGNADIHVVESRDNGTTWPLDSIVSTNANGRKYLPWMCSTAGKTFVTWYDRRASSAANPDLTAYYRSSVFDNASAASVGVGPEINASGVNDAQCAPGFPRPVSNSLEQTLCTNLPPGFIQGGTCQLATCPAGVPAPCGTAAACDFRTSTPCATAGEVCTPGGGVPKYGDYNGAACALGTLFVAWSSATPPPAPTCLVAGLPSASAAQCCSGFLSGGACAPTAAACTANGAVCGAAGVPACCSAGLNGLCQGGRCLPAIAMYAGSSCIGPGCNGLPVTITYHQTGACNGFVGTGGTSAGPNAAYVIFGIERINNALGLSAFAFDPDRLFVQQATPRFLDSDLALYPQVLGPFAVKATTVVVGANLGFAAVAQGAAVVSTTTTDGAVEANKTSYFLQYNRQPTDPQVTLAKSNAPITLFPLTQDCKTITLK